MPLYCSVKEDTGYLIAFSYINIPAVFEYQYAAFIIPV